MPKFCNLVFQGGGVRVAAYAGALSAMPNDVSIKGVGGTSGGAIVAALLAIGKTKQQIKEILFSHNFASLLESEAVERERRLQALVAKLFSAWNKPGISSLISIAGMMLNHAAVKSDLLAVMDLRGLHKSTPLENWLDSLFGDRTFADIKVQDLQIVAANVTQRSFLVYNPADHPGFRISRAVLASASIPLFFAPVSGAEHLVDGGILSNFPNFLFVNSDYPTIGFRLRDIAEPEKIEGFADFLRALVFTMAEAHDRKRTDPTYFYSYEIKTPDNITATSFDLKPTDLDALFNAGRVVGQEVKWHDHARAVPIFAFYDAHPHEVLQQTIRAAKPLFDSYGDPKSYVDELRRDVIATYRIEEDWTGTYDRDTTFTLSGKKPIVYTRLMLTPSAGGNWGGLESIADLKFVAQERVGGKMNDMPRFPARAERSKKGLLLFFSPPLMPGDTRSFTIRFAIPREYEASLGSQQPQEISYALKRLATSDTFSLRLKLLIAEQLPRLAVTKTFEAETVVENGSHYDKKLKKAYRAYEWFVPVRPLAGGEERFLVELAADGEPDGGNET